MDYAVECSVDVRKKIEFRVRHLLSRTMNLEPWQ
jgi:hypothetical protein